MTRKQARLGSLAVAGALLAIGLGVRAFIRARRYICLRGRTVLITGGSRGLGLELARQCADEGSNVVICSRDQEELDRAETELRSRGAKVLALKCDVTDHEDVDEMIRTVVGEFGSIDVLINNAGIIQVGPMQEMTFADYDEAMQTHFHGPLHTIQAALPVMRGQRGGRIVNITSIGGKVAAPHLLPYTASKFALVGFSEGLRAELARDNILVTTVAPGFFRSGSPRKAFFKGQHQKEYAWFATSDVLPGISTSPKQMARRILSAAKHGQAELITPLAASIQARLNGLLPGITSELAAIFGALLPGPGGIGNRRATGAQSQSSHTPGFAQRRNNRAGEAHNEMG